MKNFTLSWTFWALLLAAFAALTAIFAKIGIENVNSDFTTLIRTIIILILAALILVAIGNWQQPSTVSARISARTHMKNWASTMSTAAAVRSARGKRPTYHS